MRVDVYFSSVGMSMITWYVGELFRGWDGGGVWEPVFSGEDRRETWDGKESINCEGRWMEHSLQLYIKLICWGEVANCSVCHKAMALELTANSIGKIKCTWKKENGTYLRSHRTPPPPWPLPASLGGRKSYDSGSTMGNKSFSYP